VVAHSCENMTALLNKRKDSEIAYISLQVAGVRLNLIRDCMKNPIDRPTLDKLEENAEAAFMSLETSRFPGIKRLREDEMPEYMRLSLDAERWTVGSGSRKRRQATEGEGEGEV
jgi:hypothetical protein